MMSGLCGGACYATQPEYRAECIQNAGPEYGVKRSPRIQAEEQGHLWVLLQLSSSQRRRPRRYSHMLNTLYAQR